MWLSQSLLEDEPVYLGSNYKWDFYCSGMCDIRLSLFPSRTFEAQLLDFTLRAVLIWSLVWGWCSGVCSRWMNLSCQAVPSFSCHRSTGQSWAFVRSLFLSAVSITHMHMCLPLTLSSADLREAPRGKVEILLRLLSVCAASESVQGLNTHRESDRGRGESSVTEPTRTLIRGQQ